MSSWPPFLVALAWFERRMRPAQVPHTGFFWTLYRGKRLVQVQLAYVYVYIYINTAYENRIEHQMHKKGALLDEISQRLQQARLLRNKGNGCALAARDDQGIAPSELLGGAHLYGLKRSVGLGL